MAHSRPPWGSSTTTSTRVSPASAIRASAASATRAATSGLDDGRPEVDETTARLPARSKVPRPRLPALDPGQAQGVPGVEAVAHVEPAGRVPHRPGQAADHHGERRLEGLRAPGDAAEGRLQAEQAGEPGRDADRAATVAAVAMGSRPPATAAAEPPDDPPGVRSGFHGLRVVPWSLVEVQLTPPNSQAVVWAARTAPAARSRVDLGGVVVGHPVGEDQRGLGVGPAVDRLELLHPDGHAAEGQGDVGARPPRPGPRRRRRG